MSTSTSTTLPASENGRFPSLTNIPPLGIDGHNWAIFQVRFGGAMRACGLWSRFEGKKKRPDAVDPSAPTSTETAAIEAWDKEDEIARHLLIQRLPDSTVFGFNSCTTVAA